MNTLKILLILLLLMSVSILAQPQTEGGKRDQRDTEKQRQMQIPTRGETAIITSTPSGNKKIPSKQKEAEDDKRKLEVLAEINSQFAISEEYQNKYSAFLKQKDTGISRMFPDTKCDTGLTVTVEELERCSKNPLVKGSGSRYSIKLNWIPSDYPVGMIYLYFIKSDIYFNGGSLLFGNESTQSIVSEIGDVNLNEVTLTSPAGKFLVDFKPSKSKTKFQQQTKILEKGVTANGYLYSTFVPVKLNSSYIFRSIAFSSELYSGDFWNTDLYIAFKIVGQEDDGSIIFIWKKLKEKRAPYLANK